jgi:hypothetical protein
MNNHKTTRHIVKAIVPFLLACSAFAQTEPQAQTMRQELQKMRQAFAKNKQELRDYQWIETTTLTIDGKSRPPKQSMCRYAADGTLQKISLGGQQASARPQGVSLPLRGGLVRKLVAKKKKDEIQQDLTQIRALAHMYMPFDREKFTVAFTTGHVNLARKGTDKDVLVINDYAKQGDELKITLNHSTMQVEQISVKTYFDKPKDVLTATIQYSRLGDGTAYPGVTMVDAPSKQLTIAIVRSDVSKVIY